MFPQAWQVGLDIQIDCVRAVAAQRRRNGWQLRHWWQQALPQAVLRDGCLEPSEFLIRALRQWRVQLPRHISLRIALPAQRDSGGVGGGGGRPPKRCYLVQLVAFAGVTRIQRGNINRVKDIVAATVVAVHVDITVLLQHVRHFIGRQGH